MDNPRKKNKDDVKRQPPHTRVPGYGVAVKVINGNIEGAIKLFKRIVKDSGRIEELKERQEYKKPSAIKRELKQKAIRRTLKEIGRAHA